jgi:hypothetical protein
MANSVALDTSVYLVGPASIAATTTGGTVPGIKHTVTGLTIGKTYVLNGSARQASGDGGSRTARFGVTGIGEGTAIGLFTGGRGPWYPIPAYEFTATGTSHEIYAKSADSTAYTVWFDAITLTDAGQVIWTAAAGKLSGVGTAASPNGGLIPVHVASRVFGSGIDGTFTDTGVGGSADSKTQIGDLLIGVFAASTNGTITPSTVSGWTLLGSNFGTNGGGRVYYKYAAAAGSSEGLTQNWTGTVRHAQVNISTYRYAVLDTANTTVQNNGGNSYDPPALPAIPNYRRVVVNAGVESTVSANTFYHAAITDRVNSCSTSVVNRNDFIGVWDVDERAGTAVDDSGRLWYMTGGGTLGSLNGVCGQLVLRSKEALGLPVAPYVVSAFTNTSSSDVTSATADFSIMPDDATQVGDLLLFAVTRGPGTTTAAPSGFTLLQSHTETGAKTEVFYKISNGTEATSLTTSTTWDTASTFSAMGISIRGQHHSSDPAVFISDFITKGATGTTYHDFIADDDVTAGEDNSLALAFVGFRESTPSASGNNSNPTYNTSWYQLDKRSSNSATLRDSHISTFTKTVAAGGVSAREYGRDTSVSHLWGKDSTSNSGDATGITLIIAPQKSIQTAATGSVTVVHYGTAVATTGPDCISNGNFSNFLTGWTAGSAMNIYNNSSGPDGSNCMNWTAIGASPNANAYVSTPVTGLRVGVTYRVRAWVQGAPQVELSVVGMGNSGTFSPSTDWVSFNFVATATTGEFRLTMKGTWADGAGGFLDDVTIREFGLNPIPAAAGRVTDFGTAATTAAITTAASGTVSRSSTASYTLSTTAIVEAAAGLVTDTATASHTVPITVAATISPIVDTATATRAVTYTVAATPAAMTKTSTAAVTISPTPLGTLSGITRNGQASFTVSTTGITEVTSGFVTDFGTASLVVNDTHVASGFVTDTATAATTVAYTVAAAAGAVTKPATLTRPLTITPVTTGLVTDYGTASRTVTITPASSANVWASYFWQPDALLVQTGLSGVVANIQDSPTAPDGNALTPSGGAINLRMSFENPGSQLRKQSGDQIIRVRVTAV